MTGILKEGNGMREERKDESKISEETEQQHSMVCNDQLFFQELRIAAEEAERDYLEDKNKNT
jgi:hypothetical protein